MKKLFSLFGFFLVTLTAKEPIRTWTSADGRTLEARFLEMLGTKVRIENALGRKFTVPLTRFSEEDQAHVDEIIQKLETNVKNSKKNHIVRSARNMELIWVEPGSFLMGLDTRDQNSSKSWGYPQHHVTLTQGFYLGKFEVTIAEYSAVTETKFKGSPNLPVTLVVSDMQDFLEKLNYLEAEFVDKNWSYALPTEAEWEYACRAGAETLFHWGNKPDHKKANMGEKNRVLPVGSYPPNNWGFYDMHGNVSELTSDIWYPYTSEPKVDPVSPEIELLNHVPSTYELSGNANDTYSRRISRGGSYSRTFDGRIDPYFCQSARRYSHPGGGFRVVYKPNSKISRKSSGNITETISY